MMDKADEALGGGFGGRAAQGDGKDGVQVSASRRAHHQHLRTCRSKPSRWNIRSLLEDEEEIRDLPFVGSAIIGQGADTVAVSIAATLEFEFRGNGRLFKASEQSAGVFVLLAGDLGSYHTALGARFPRAISDRIAPFVIINDQDARAARSFTLLHELAHVWLDTSGVSGAPSPETPTSLHDRIERFCNDVAGEFLLPAAALRTRTERLVAGNKETAAEFIRVLSDDWSVSEPMAAYRLNRIGLVETGIYRELVADYAARWQRHRRHLREQNRDNGSGPDRHVVIVAGSAMRSSMSRGVTCGKIPLPTPRRPSFSA